MKRLLFVTLAAFAFTGCTSTPKDTNSAQNTPELQNGRFPADYVEGKSKHSNLDDLDYVAEKGNFYVILGNGTRCQITAGIKDFRMFGKGNFALAYETSSGDLVMMRQGETRARECYSQKPYKMVITDSQSAVTDWTMVNRVGSPIVLAALDRNGKFRMYDEAGNETSKLSVDRVEEYRINPCFGVKSIPFKSKLAFAFGGNKILTMEADGTAKIDPGNYRSVADFIETNKISCN